MGNNIEGLIDRLGKATEGSSDLNAMIWLALFAPDYRFPEPVLNRVPADYGEAWERMHWDGGGGYKVAGVLPNYTGSIDGALRLLEQVAGSGVEWEATTLYGIARVTIGLNLSDNESAEDKGGSVPMAMCLATLRYAQRNISPEATQEKD